VVVVVEKHRHCVICGMPVKPDRNPPVCSIKCEVELKRGVRREKLMWTLPFIIIMIMMFLVLLFVLRGA
jgi:predicted nucleic acid-binding Zn ribbon protein